MQSWICSQKGSASYTDNLYLSYIAFKKCIYRSLHLRVLCSILDNLARVTECFENTIPKSLTTNRNLIQRTEGREVWLAGTVSVTTAAKKLCYGVLD